MIEILNKIYFFNVLKDVSLFLVDTVAILSSVLAGLAIGWERESAGKAAGIRTFAIVCLGSTLFTLIARELNAPDSMPRIVGQIISGIGFIGAGAVFRENEKISGLTTAAGIWVSSAIGIIFGLGYLPFGILISIFVVFLFRLQKHAESLLYGKCIFEQVEVTFRNDGNKNVLKVMAVLESDRRLNLRFSTCDDKSLSRFRFEGCTNHKNHRQFLQTIASFDFIVSIDTRIPPIQF